MQLLCGTGEPRRRRTGLTIERRPLATSVAATADMFPSATARISPLARSLNRG